MSKRRSALPSDYLDKNRDRLESLAAGHLHFIQVANSQYQGILRLLGRTSKDLVPGSTVPADDPVVGLYRKYQEVDAKAAATDDMEASSDLVDYGCYIRAAMMKTEATTVAGVRAKLAVAIEQWPADEEDLDHHEDCAIAAIRDAMRILAPEDVA
jgi:hypothetical protein